MVKTKSDSYIVASKSLPFNDMLAMIIMKQEV